MTPASRQRGQRRGAAPRGVLHAAFALDFAEQGALETCEGVILHRRRIREAEEVYTRPLPLTSCQEDRLGLDYTVPCYG